MKEELRVRYKVERCIDRDFDAGLAAFAKEHGWYFYGGGFNHKTRMRDLVFDREEVADDKSKVEATCPIKIEAVVARLEAQFDRNEEVAYIPE